MEQLQNLRFRNITPLFKPVDKWYNKAMIFHELHKEVGNVVADLRATTKVGLMSAAVEALAGAMNPSYISEDEVERKFAVKADDYRHLMEVLLTESNRLSEENNEVYEGARFTLITANEAKGEFVGQVIKGKAMHVSTIEVGETIEKNDDKEWTANITFSA